MSPLHSTRKCTLFTPVGAIEICNIWINYSSVFELYATCKYGICLRFCGMEFSLLRSLTSTWATPQTVQSCIHWNVWVNRIIFNRMNRSFPHTEKCLSILTCKRQLLFSFKNQQHQNVKILMIILYSKHL